MAKTLERNKAIKLRLKGRSIKDISKILKVSKGTVSLWCRDIKLTSKQIDNLHKQMIAGGYIGRMKGAKIQYENRLKRIEEGRNNGIKAMGRLSDRDILIAFTALYWGEGCKKSRQFALNNSDPEMIKFIMNTLRRIWKINDDRFSIRVGINVIHKNRDEEVKKYWSEIIRIPVDKFKRTTFIKAKRKKIYKNFFSHYGTLTVRVNRPVDIYYQIMGLIAGLSQGI